MQVLFAKKKSIKWKNQWLTIFAFTLQTLICDVHAMTSDHHKWTQVNDRICLLFHLKYSSQFDFICCFLCRMTNCSWRVSWFWPQLNLCASTPLFLLLALPTACSTTNKKWTPTLWKGTLFGGFVPITEDRYFSETDKEAKWFFLFVFYCRCFKRHSRAALNRQQELSHLPMPPQLRLYDYIQRRKERKPAPVIDLKISKAGNVRTQLLCLF